MSAASSSTPELPIQTAARLLAEGRPSQAVDRLAALVAGAPTYAAAHVLHATALEAAGRIDDALVAWSRAAALVPGSPLVHRERARLLASHREPLEAAADTLPPAVPLSEDPVEDPLSDDVLVEDLLAEDVPEEDPVEDSQTEPEGEAPVADEPESAFVEVTPFAPAADLDDPFGEPDVFAPVDLWDDEPADEQPVEADEPSREDEDDPATEEPAAEPEAESDASVPPPAPPQAPAPPEDPFAVDPFAEEDLGAPTPSSLVFPMFEGFEPTEEPESDPSLEDEEPAEQVPAPPPAPEPPAAPETPATEPAAGRESAPEAAAPEALPSDDEPAPPAGDPTVADELDALISQLEVADRIRPDPTFNGPEVSFDNADVDEMASETLAKIYAAQHQFDEAARIYEKLAARQPENADELLRRAAEMRERG